MSRLRNVQCAEREVFERDRSVSANDECNDRNTTISAANLTYPVAKISRRIKPTECGQV
jgi:hypothetical protein